MMEIKVIDSKLSETNEKGSNIKSRNKQNCSVEKTIMHLKIVSTRKDRNTYYSIVITLVIQLFVITSKQSETKKILTNSIKKQKKNENEESKQLKNEIAELRVSEVIKFFQQFAIALKQQDNINGEACNNEYDK
ncbi:hypothetical protein RFI_01534 [Reticulomyxa filosa]|uniref:Transmembrane protein n=1 Tax=Reticulomyxa filosa TaxID=46433 RepID=X6PBN3_RETFI|nr:hypothetical protein RFI_01534 [Reticulomyxa filosa]|eukprot:ETO35528.1 hypothetical protein RFI_01534 [Reticulomyxa filosa]